MREQQWPVRERKIILKKNGSRIEGIWVQRKFYIQILDENERKVSKYNSLDKEKINRRTF